MRRYEVTFWKTGSDKEILYVARAVVGADSTDEAVQVTYKLLKPKYPEIEVNDRFVGYCPDFSMAFPKEPCELATH
ncbi:hypothetical protein CN03_10630 [Thalassolituus oleivorans]|uniref:hypothetical protein n=1 Tax=Thalassolituus oleivorans TaxID=187493 RepID=UPI000949259C|nr:hypothetical protein [Thalassolituus oleivorans]APR67342.1 hypothetical protein CN03_10630 [Thalassolituus oleivorans]